MTHEYSVEAFEAQEVNEPGINYSTSSRKSLRTISDEELAQSMTLDELDNHLTELIHHHYHAK